LDREDYKHLSTYGGGGGESNRIVDIIFSRKKNWFGHVMRGNELMMDVMEGIVLGKGGLRVREV